MPTESLILKLLSKPVQGSDCIKDLCSKTSYTLTKEQFNKIQTYSEEIHLVNSILHKLNQELRDRSFITSQEGGGF